MALGRTQICPSTSGLANLRSAPVLGLILRCVKEITRARAREANHCRRTRTAGSGGNVRLSSTADFNGAKMRLVGAPQTGGSQSGTRPPGVGASALMARIARLAAFDAIDLDAVALV